MVEPVGSKTALLVAGYRARATDEKLAGCDDPWAISLAGEEGVALSHRWDAFSPQMKLWVALRTRAIDAFVRDQLETDAQVQQVVILGAGLDTRAVRLAKPGVTFFEVDHPATQAHKRRTMASLGEYPQDAAVYVPCDFESENFVDNLVAAGLDASKRCCVVWEGVVYYLHEPAARETLRTIATRLHPGSCLVFDLLNSNMAKRTEKLRPEDRGMLEIVEELGEPMHYGIDDPVPLLHESGFKKMRTMSFDELALQYTGTYERERYFRFQWIAVASASPNASFGM